jgi:hypothetical protein
MVFPLRAQRKHLFYCEALGRDVQGQLGNVLELEISLLPSQEWSCKARCQEVLTRGVRGKPFLPRKVPRNFRSFSFVASKVNRL